MEQLAKVLHMPTRTTQRVDDAIEQTTRVRRAGLFMVALLAGALGLLWLASLMAKRDDAASIRQLPSDARHALYVRTLDEIETICLREPAAVAGAVFDHCVAQARFLLELPECEGTCQGAARSMLPHAHR